MSDEFGKLSVPDLQALIERAHQEIERRKEAGRETLRAEIEAQLINSGLELTDLFPEAVRGVARARKTKAKEDGKATVPKYKVTPAARHGPVAARVRHNGCAR